MRKINIIFDQYCDKKEEKKKSSIILRSKTLRLGWQSLACNDFLHEKKYQIFIQIPYFFRNKLILSVYLFDFL